MPEREDSHLGGLDYRYELVACEIGDGFRDALGAHRRQQGRSYGTNQRGSPTAHLGFHNSGPEHGQEHSYQNVTTNAE